MSATSADYQALAVDRVAKAYNIAPATLWGVYGTESGYGTNLGPSSAGARGPFQFMPGTAKTYGLNDTTVEQFGPSLVAAARYLKSLGANANPNSRQTIAALNAYNGNGGGSTITSYAQSVANDGAGYWSKLAGATIDTGKSQLEQWGLTGTENQIVQAIGLGALGASAGLGGARSVVLGAAGLAAGAAPLVGNPISSAADAIKWIFTNWLRVLEFVAGAVFAFMGLTMLGRSAMQGAH